MSQASNPRGEASATDRRTTIVVIGILAALVAATAGGVWWILSFADGELERQRRAWSERLSLVVEARRAAVSEWFEGRKAEVGGLAENQTVRLFMTQLAYAGYELASVNDGMAQRTYVSNLLSATASRAGFTGPVLGPEIDANVQRRATAGLAIVEPSGKPVVATRHMPGIELPPGSTEATGPRLLEAFQDPEGKLALSFYAPVFGIQANAEPGNALGFVVALTRAGAALREHLAQPGATARSLRSVLLATRESQIVNLTPLGQDLPPFAVRVPESDTTRALAYAMSEPGKFAVREGPGTDGDEVLVTARAVPGTDWVLATMADRAEVLGPAESRVRRTALALILAVALAVSAMLALWWHGTSRRAALAIADYRAVNATLQHQRELLRRVTDTQPTAIFIADGSDRVTFANRRVADEVGAEPEDLIGKTLTAIFGPALAERLSRLNRTAHSEQTPQTARLDADDGVRGIWLSHHLPLPELAGEPPGVLSVQVDITNEVGERLRRERTLNQLIDTIMSLVDHRDPHAARKSQRVGQLARRLAEEIGLAEPEREAARIAGTLMNIGKILVPNGVLTRAGPLSADEIRQIHEGAFAVADLMQDIEFDGPVAETLRQVHERVDGRGDPNGLKGDEILPTARVAAVANAFIGMISSRADRPAMPLEAAEQALWSAAGSAYDTAVVAALVTLLETRGLKREIEAGEH